MSVVRVRFPQERHQQMIDLIAERGRVATAELATLFDVSLATARRDLDVLEHAGLVSRTHGGVVLRGRNDGSTEPLFLEKLRQHQNLKQRIGIAAAEELPDGKVAILDSGTTTLAIARAIAGRPVTIVTIDLKVAEAAASGATEVHLVGGHVRNGYFSIVGAWATSALQSIRADVAFMAADAIDEAGITNSTFDEAEVKRVVLSRASRCVLVADHSKLGARSFADVCPLDEVDLFVTDRGAEPMIGPYRQKIRDIRLV
ncbi:DeoR/GlpR family DNA-binding transcription regulator [Aquamicrobium sp. LC103]|uniref:DeoR/GlpR family DNA-binding transcription regulator n=1 Tax=Aquamicrobium sp. LC103 TaxID=1120658 RepID=UPI00148510A6|nr:DeoR/GlpR family DNA-binding transcription regulator [Aquamicrobium sp. LC103]